MRMGPTFSPEHSCCMRTAYHPAAQPTTSWSVFPSPRNERVEFYLDEPGWGMSHGCSRCAFTWSAGGMYTLCPTACTHVCYSRQHHACAVQPVWGVEGFMDTSSAVYLTGVRRDPAAPGGPKCHRHRRRLRHDDPRAPSALLKSSICFVVSYPLTQDYISYSILIPLNVHFHFIFIFP